MYRSVCVLVCSISVIACNGNGPVAAGDEIFWVATLEGTAGWEHISGETSVEYVEGASAFTATAQIEGDQPGVRRPWHVHFNSCAEGGGIVGQDGSYPRLEVGAAGTAVVTATIGQPLDATATYHVNVHRADDDLGTIIACGDMFRVELPGPESG